MTISVNNVEEAGTVTFDSATPTVGTTLTTTLTDPDGGTVIDYWVWKRSSNWTGTTGTWREISGITSASYTPVTEDAGKHLSAAPYYADVLGGAKFATGYTTSEVAAGPPAKPDAPPTLTAGNAQITVSWTAPANGGSNITGYKV